jgi:membrane protein required for colicin V production
MLWVDYAILGVITISALVGALRGFIKEVFSLPVLLVGGLLNYLLGRLVVGTGLSGTDRLLGGLFGAARGLALVVAILLAAGLTPIPADPWWKESPGIARMMPLVGWAASYLPESVAQHLDFEPEPPKGPETPDTPEKRAMPETPESEAEADKPPEVDNA